MDCIAKKRAKILFKEFPNLENAYRLTMCFRGIYEYSKSKEEAITRVNKWLEKIKEKGSEFDSFLTAGNSIVNHFDSILNYFETDQLMLQLNLSMLKLKLLEQFLEVLGMSNFSCLDYKNYMHNLN